MAKCIKCEESVICIDFMGITYTFVCVCVSLSECIQHIVQVFLYHFSLNTILLPNFSLKKEKKRKRQKQIIYDVYMTWWCDFVHDLSVSLALSRCFLLPLFLYNCAHMSELSFCVVILLSYSSVDSHFRSLFFLSQYFVLFRSSYRYTHAHNMHTYIFIYTQNCLIFFSARAWALACENRA